MSYGKESVSWDSGDVVFFSFKTLFISK